MYIPDEASENKKIVGLYRSLLRVWYTRKTPADKKLVRKAFNIAVDAHKDMRRKSGEPFVYHPLEVARIAAGEIGLGTTSIICALIHDVVEDTDFTLAEVKGIFGETVAKIIDGLTKIEEIFDHQNSSLQAENFKKMLLTLSDDVRVILIKLADRLHNMRTLDAMPREKQLKIASETHFLYAPLAYRLGLYAIKSELEDLALKYTEPEIYANISAKLKNTKADRAKFLKKFITPLKKALHEQQIKYQIFTREKSISSIWEKMQKKEIPFEEIYDLFAVQIVIDTPPSQEKINCWKVYSIITDNYRPNMKKLRDWISNPKANAYEALHTTVMSQSGKWAEVQIQSVRMHEIATKGYAAHWKYKTAIDENEEGGIEEWLGKIRETLQSNEENALDFLNEFKLNLFSDEIFVYTPKGDLKSMPYGSTVLDFAYNIHTQIGNASIGAKVNHKLMPLNYKLKSGDQVEIITSHKQKPKIEWYDFVVTARAKSNIKNTIREERKKSKEAGMKKLQEYFQQINVELSNHNINVLQQKLGYASSIDLFYFIADNTVDFKEIKSAFPETEKSKWLKYFSLSFGKSKNNEQKTAPKTEKENLRITPGALLLEKSMGNLNYTIMNCCSPIPGDDVIGIVSKEKIINIHRTQCQTAIQEMSKFGHRIVKTKWDKKESIAFLAGLRMNTIDNIGLVHKITRVISEEFGINMRSFHMTTSAGFTNAVITLYVNDLENFNNLISRLKQLPEIKKVSRIDQLTEVKDML